MGANRHVTDLSPAPSVEAMQAIANRYQEKFPNWDEIEHPLIVMEPRFLAMLAQAVYSNTPLTRADLERVFDRLGWDE